MPLCKGFLAFLICPASISIGLAADLLPTPHSSLIEKSVAVNTTDWKAQPDYSFRERDVKSKIDGDGQVKSHNSKTYEVTMIEGSPYDHLIAIDNEPLSPDQRRQEEIKLEREIARRKGESVSERRARISKYKDERSEEHLLMQQMVAAFKFRFVREEEIEGVGCYHFEATPNPDYRPSVEKARVLTGMRGQLWIDKQQYHWVKVEAQVTKPVSFGFFIAQVKPGTSFELDQIPVGNVWLPKHFLQTVDASVFGFYGYRSKEESFYSDYSRKPLNSATAQ